jgi:cytochrome c oxidase subunit 3
MEIPYSAAPRADTGVTNATLGMWLFIASEVMLFGSLFSSYALLRAGAASWPDQSAILNLPLAVANTGVLLASNAAMLAAAKAAAAGRLDRLHVRLGVVIGLGLLFLGIKSAEYAGELGRGLRPATNNFIALYFALTGLHAAHVAGGLAANGWLLITATRAFATRRDLLSNRVRVAGLYWSFVDIIWLAIFVTLYLL